MEYIYSVVDELVKIYGKDSVRQVLISLKELEESIRIVDNDTTESCNTFGEQVSLFTEVSRKDKLTAEVRGLYDEIFNVYKKDTFSKILNANSKKVSYNVVLDVYNGNEISESVTEDAHFVLKKIKEDMVSGKLIDTGYGQSINEKSMSDLVVSINVLIEFYGKENVKYLMGVSELELKTLIANPKNIREKTNIDFIGKSKGWLDAHKRNIKIKNLCVNDILGLYCECLKYLNKIPKEFKVTQGDISEITGVKRSFLSDIKTLKFYKVSSVDDIYFLRDELKTLHHNLNKNKHT